MPRRHRLDAFAQGVFFRRALRGEGLVEILRNRYTEDLAASDEDSRNIHFVYGIGTETKKAGDFKIKKGTNVIFETSEENLFLDEEGTIPYDPSDLTSDITVYRLKR